MWFGIMGLPNYLFKKYKITYYKKPWQHVLFYIFSIIILFIIYKDFFSMYFNKLSVYFFLAILFLFLFWIFIPSTYKNDYYLKKERFHYQLPKFFEIMFQQLCFLGGLLTFGVSPVVFGLVFFVAHIPMVFLISRKFSLSVIAASLIGGLIFAYLQSQGILGFLTSLSLHLAFWLVFHNILSRQYFLGIMPVKR
jgi:hypothetical protein